MAFARKIIDLIFQVGEGAFLNGQNTVTVRGLRVKCTIENYGAPSQNIAHARVYGLPPSLLNSLYAYTKIQTGNGYLQLKNNTVQIYAGDIHGIELVAQGVMSIGSGVTIRNGEAVLEVVTMPMAFVNTQVLPPLTYPGPTDARQILQKLASLAGLNFNDSQAPTAIMLSNPAVSGSLGEQIRKVAEAANLGWSVENGTLKIVDWNAPSSASPILISPQTGLIEYPMGTATGIELETLFNSAIHIFSVINVQNDPSAANMPWMSGTFTCFGVTHIIESETPGGDWLTRIQAFPYAA